MFELTIKKADGSIYWQQLFDSRSHAESWLVEEQTRRYWVGTYSYEIVDKTPNPQIPSAIEVCHKNRAAAYPPIGDQLDAAFKARQGDASQQSAIDAAIAAVKAQFPKP